MYFVDAFMLVTCCSGTAGATAATNGYIADCTPAVARAWTFSLTLGLRFTGMAIGPTRRALLVHVTGPPVIAPVLVVGTHVAYVLAMMFIVPESLSPEKRVENRWVRHEMRETSQWENRGRRLSFIQLLLSPARNVFREHES